MNDLSMHSGRGESLGSFLLEMEYLQWACAFHGRLVGQVSTPPENEWEAAVLKRAHILASST